jgi:hypothetical protein
MYTKLIQQLYNTFAFLSLLPLDTLMCMFCFSSWTFFLMLTSLHYLPILIHYLLTPCNSIVHLEKLTGSQLVKKFSTFYGTQRFISTFKNARHLSLSWASLIQSVPPHPTSGSAVCISVCLTSLTLCTFNSWEKWFLHLSKVLWESATKSPFSTFAVLVLGWHHFSKAANLFVISIWYCFLTPSSFSFLRLNLPHQTSVLLVYLLPVFTLPSQPTNSDQ